MPQLPLPLAPGKNHFTFCQKSFDKSKYNIQVEPHSPFVTGLVHLADCLQGLSILEHMSEFSSLLTAE